jgi:hypothetical protein
LRLLADRHGHQAGQLAESVGTTCRNWSYQVLKLIAPFSVFCFLT